MSGPVYRFNPKPSDDAFLRLIHAVVLEAQANRRDAADEAASAARAFIRALGMYVTATAPEVKGDAEKQDGFPPLSVRPEPVPHGVDGVERQIDPLPVRKVIAMAESWAKRAGTAQAIGCLPPPTHELIAALSNLAGA